MRHLDLSYEGRRQADRNQSNNGRLPHGGNRGTRKFPPCHLSYDKGTEFQQKVHDEIEKLLEDNEIALKGTSPSWALLVSREPSYTNESPLITNSFMSASKSGQSNGVGLHNRKSLLPSKKTVRPPKRQGLQFYRPNSTHQYLSATELKNSSEGEVNIQYGRPTRTTLLRARQRCSSAPMNSYDKKRETDTRLEELRTAPSISSTPGHLHLDKDGETLHSFLIGARYNRAHCLDSRSVEHTGVYMPRHNPAMGAFFTGPKGHEYLKEFDDTPRSDLPTPPSQPRTRRRPTTAPTYGRRPPPTHPPPRSQLAWAEVATHAGPQYKYRQARLNIVGYRLPIGGGGRSLDPNNEGLKLPILQGRSLTSPRRHPLSIEDTYRAYQPPPTPTSIQQPSTGKLESDAHEEAILEFRPERDADVVQETEVKPASPLVSVPTDNDDDDVNAKMNNDEVNDVAGEAADETFPKKYEVSEEEAAFAAATVAAAIAAAVDEVSKSRSKVEEEEMNGEEEGSSGVEKEANEEQGEENKDKEEIETSPEEPEPEPEEKKQKGKGVRFFITEKTPETKNQEDDDENNNGDADDVNDVEEENYEGEDDGFEQDNDAENENGDETMAEVGEEPSVDMEEEREEKEKEDGDNDGEMNDEEGEGLNEGKEEQKETAEDGDTDAALQLDNDTEEGNEQPPATEEES